MRFHEIFLLLTGKGDFRHYAPEKTARLQAHVRAFFARSQIKLCVFFKKKMVEFTFLYSVL